jgi:hypothetical protein
MEVFDTSDMVATTIELAGLEGKRWSFIRGMLGSSLGPDICCTD